MTRASIGLLLGLVVVIGCGRASEDQRARAELEGRNLQGSSAASRDDRVPAFEGGVVVHPRGYLDGAFALASVDAEVLAAMTPTLARRWPELGGVIEGSRGARLSGSARAIAAGMHVRVHVWMDASATWEAAVIGQLGRMEGGCPSTAIACGQGGGQGGGWIAVVRAMDGGYVVDAWVTEPGAVVEVGVIEEGLGRVSGEGPAALAELRGDLVGSIDGPAAIAALRSVRPELGATIDRLRDAERLFAGLTVEVAWTDRALHGRVRWVATDDGRERLREVFALDPVDADVPSLAALCDGALACGRSRGLPSRERLVGLATGIYREPNAVLAVLDQPEAWVLALETWPNAVAAGVRWPGEVGDPGEAMVLQSTAEISRRVLGFGFSVRADGAWLAYARMGAADLDSVARFASLAGSGFSPVTLEQVDARVESMSGRRVGLASSVYRVVDPDGAWGWLVTADHDEQLAWFTALAHDDGAVPLAYVEIPNVGELVAARSELARSLGWLAPALGVRAQINLSSEWAPELRFVVGER